MDVGSELRTAREQRGLSLHDISDRTKISMAVLGALETNNLERLPAGVFTRGFLKAYAREVGLDPIDIVEGYAAQFPAPAHEENADRDRMIDDDGPDPALAYGSEPSNIGRTIATLAVVLLAYFAFTRVQGSRSATPPETQRSDAILVSTGDAQQQNAATLQAAATTGAADTAAAPAQSALRLDVEATGDCWISAAADGERVAYRLMHAGERQTIQVNNELVLRVGDPATFQFTINGAAGHLPARANEPLTVTITPNNYRDFLGR